MAGPDMAGPDMAGPDMAGPEMAGPEMAVPSRAIPVPEVGGPAPAVTPLAEPTAALTVTLAIPLTGEALTPQTRRLLDALRELVELGQGTVTTTTMSPPAPAPGNGWHGSGLHANGSGLPVNGSGLPVNGSGPPAGGAGWSANGTALFSDGAGWPAPATGRPAGDAGWSAGGAGSPVGGTRVPPAVDPADVRLLTASRQVLLGGEPCAMTRLEFDLLLFLAGNPRRVFTRAQLLGAVWGYEHTGERTVDVHVRRLRVKMGVQVPLITTVYGVGYRLDDDARITVVAHE